MDFSKFPKKRLIFQAALTPICHDKGGEVWRKGNKVLELLKLFIKDERGATAVEYGLLVAALSVLVAAGILATGDSIVDLFTTISTWLTSR